ncbi:MAG TPA: hypothetical protein VN615_18280 [Gaiellales bacterium]|nr:hypothetical protein [Gaiellales bacterium]
MRVLVVARTQMFGPHVCVGGVELATGRSLRLKRLDGSNALESHPIRPGSIWEMAYTPCPSVVPPHVEDVLVSGGHWVEDVADMRSAILVSWQPWDCPLDEIFEGRLDATDGGSGFLPAGPVLPSCSTGFWLSRQRATIDSFGRYRFENARLIKGVKWKGTTAPAQTIPPGALIRFSLAKWKEFSPEEGERCYLQLSAWYP